MDKESKRKGDLFLESMRKLYPLYYGNECRIIPTTVDDGADYMDKELKIDCIIEIPFRGYKDKVFRTGIQERYRSWSDWDRYKDITPSSYYKNSGMLGELYKMQACHYCQFSADEDADEIKEAVIIHWPTFIAGVTNGLIKPNGKPKTNYSMGRNIEFIPYHVPHIYEHAKVLWHYKDGVVEHAV